MNTETKNSSNQLSLFVVSCHMDKELTEEINPSKYEIPIQAGAALTDKRTAELNDHDGFPESISDRNHRYSELSAIYYIWKNVKTPYIGISHYRRRFILSDRLLDKYMEEGFDIIIPKPWFFDDSLENMYSTLCYGYDWTLVLKLIKQLSPDYYDTAVEFSKNNYMHACCMGIYKREVFDHCCSWLFPILENFYQLRKEKTDIHQCRDVGFIAERLFSIYFMHHQNDLNILQARILQLSSIDNPEQELDKTNEELLRKTAFQLIENRQITKCMQLLFQDDINHPSLSLLQSILYTFVAERSKNPETFFEYLEDSCNPEHLCNVFQTLHMHLNDLNTEFSLENQEKFLDFIHQTRFTCSVIIKTLEMLNLTSETLINNIAMLFHKSSKKTYVLPLLEFSLTLYPDSSMTYFNIAYFLCDIGEWYTALKYLNQIKETDTEEVGNLRNHILSNIS